MSKCIRDDPPKQKPPTRVESQRPEIGPRCCRREMEWLGRESITVGIVAVSYDEWRCGTCGKVKRLPTGEYRDD